MSATLAAWRRPATGRALLHAAAIGLGVFALAFVSLTLLGDRRALLVWLPNALVLALLLRAPKGEWARIIAAAGAGLFAASLVGADAPLRAADLALVNVLEPLGCALMLRWREEGEFDLIQTPSLVRFVAIAGIAAPLADAVLARVLLAATGQSTAHLTLVLWSLGDALGFLIVTPAFLAFSRLRTLLHERPLTPQGMLSLAVVLLLSALVFDQSRYPAMFVLIPALLWVSLELEVLGATLGVILMSATALTFTLQGQGPIANMTGGMFSQAIELQLFLAASVLTSVLMAAMRTQRRRLAASTAVALAETQDQARRARMAEEVAAVGYWRLDVASSKVEWSDQMYRIFGLPRGQAIDLDLAMGCLHPDEQRLASQRLAEGLRTGRAWSSPITRVQRADGGVRYVTGRTVYERDDSGKVVAAFGTLADITDLTLAELALADSERLLAETADRPATRSLALSLRPT